MQRYPALDIEWLHPGADDRADRILAELDAFSVIAVETTAAGMRVFFPDSASRDAAFETARAMLELTVSSVDVADEDWAARSQASLEPVVVDDLVISPPWHAAAARAESRVIVIQPSMGFGTGHHASTRLCLRWLQALPIAGARVIDVGTGSGVLAIAAVALGARSALGIDLDDDAITAARENVELNDAERRVELRTSTLEDAAGSGQRFDVVVANITGALIARAADMLRALAVDNGLLIASGFQTDERDAVTAALESAGWAAEAELEEQDWLAVLYKTTPGVVN